MPENVTSITVNQLNAAHRKALQALRRPVTDAAKAFGAVREKLTDLAPKVMKLYNAIVAESETFTFVEFCRMFDPSIPTHAADRDGVIGYRNHRVYYTLQYMRRAVQTANTGRRRGQQGVRDSATDALARTLATILQIVAEPEQVYAAVQSEFAFGERLMTRLRKRVEATKPLIKLETSKPAKIGKVVHMERAAAPATDAVGNPLGQPGQRVRVAS
jgi:hypothetical protein